MSFGASRIRFGRLGLAYVTLGLFLSALVSACAQATPPPEPVTITFAYPDVDAGTYQELVQKFNESYPHITVELRPKTWDIFGGLDPGDADVFVASQFALGWMREQDEILSLDSFIEGDRSFDQPDFYPGTMELYAREGNTWAIPAGVDMMLMFYNQDLFDENGAPYPEIGWTWDDFLNTLIALRDEEASVFGYAPNYASFDLLPFIYQHGGRIFDDLQNPTRTAFDDPLTIDALEWYVGLMYDYDVVPTPEKAREAFGTTGSIQDGVRLSKVGMWTGMLSDLGGQFPPPDWGIRWGVAPLPRDDRPATLSMVEGYYISSQTGHPDACWQWIAFLSQQTKSRVMPVRRSLAESSAYEQRVGGDVAAVARDSMETALLLSPRLAEFEEALGVFQGAINQIVNGSATPEEAMVWAQQRFED